MNTSYINKSLWLCLLTFLWVSFSMGQDRQVLDAQAGRQELFFGPASKGQLTNLKLQEFTLEAWIYPTDKGQDGGILGFGLIADYVDDGKRGATGYHLNYKDGKIFFTVGFVDATEEADKWKHDWGFQDVFTLISTEEVAPFEWSHIVATFDGRAMQIAINGVKGRIATDMLHTEIAYDVGSYWHGIYAQDNYPYTYLNIGQSAWIKSDGTGYAKEFKGMIDNVKIWDHAKLLLADPNETTMGFEEGLMFSFTGYKNSKGSYDVSRYSRPSILENTAAVRADNQSYGTGVRNSRLTNTYLCQVAVAEQAPSPKVEEGGCNRLKVSWNYTALDNTGWKDIETAHKYWVVTRHAYEEGTTELSSCTKDIPAKSTWTNTTCGAVSTAKTVKLPWNCNFYIDEIPAVSDYDQNDYYYEIRAYNAITDTYSKSSKIKGRVHYPPTPINITSEITSAKEVKIKWDLPKSYLDRSFSAPIPDLTFFAENTEGDSIMASTSTKVVDDEININDYKGQTISYKIFSNYKSCKQRNAQVTTNVYIPLELSSAPATLSIATKVNEKQDTVYTLSWYYPSSEVKNVEGFKIYKDGELIDDIKRTSTSNYFRYDLSIVSECGEFDFYVKAYNIWNSLQSPTITKSISPSIQMTPVHASKAKYGNRVLLSWEQVSGAAGFRIFRNEEQISTVYDPKAVSYSDYNTLPGEFYTYRVEAYLSCETAAPSSQEAFGFTLPNGTITGRVETPNGQLVEDVTVRVSPIVNGSFFTGNSPGHIKVDHGVNVDMSQPFTIEFWMYLPANYSSGALMWFGGDVLSVNRNTNAIELRTWDNITALSVSNLNLEDKWSQITLVKGSDRKYKLYQDGVLKKGATAAPMVNGRGDIGGLLINSGSPNTSGNIGVRNAYYDEVRIWNKGFSHQEIQNHYTRTLTGSEPNLQLYLRLDAAAMGLESDRLAAYNIAQNTIDADIIGTNENEGEFVSSGATELTTAGKTGADGVFSIENINYGGINGKNFSVIPSNARLDEFSPASQSITLNPDRTVVDQVEFTDVSVMPVSGYITYRKLDNIEDDYYDGRAEECYVENAELLVDGESTSPPTLTDINGFYKTDVVLGSHEFSVRPIVTRIEDRIPKNYLWLASDPTMKMVVDDFDTVGIREAFTWEMWFSVDSTLNDDYHYLLKAGDLQLRLEKQSNRLKLFSYLGAGGNYPIALVDIDLKKWYHVALSYDQKSSTVVFFLNGQNVAQKTNAPAFNMASKLVTIGENLGANIAELRYWSAVRSKSEIEALNNQLLTAAEDDLRYYWDFEEGGGTVVKNNTDTPGGNAQVTAIVGKYDWRSVVMPIVIAPSADQEPPMREVQQYFRIADQTLPDSTYNFIINQPKTGVNFHNITGYTLSGVIAGRCGFDVGTSTVIIQSVNGCFEYQKDGVEGSFTFENLPPLRYKIDVIPTEHPSVRFDPQIVDLVENKSVDFLYRSPLKIEIVREGLGDEIACNLDQPVEEWAFHMNQFGYNDRKAPYQVKVRVYEEYFGQKCYVEDADIRVVDNISDTTFTTSFFSSPLKEYSETSYPFTEFDVVAKTPNSASGGDHPFQKSITVTATDKDGRQAQDEVWVYISGKEELDKTFTTAIDDLPLYVLKDPPGDESYSYVEAGESICRTYDLSVLESLVSETELKMDAGPNLLIGLIGKILTIKSDIVNGLKVELEYGAVTDSEIQICATFTEKISTSDDILIVGEDADLFMGSGVNYIYGEVKKVDYNLESCTVDSIKRELSGTIEDINTFYTFTRFHVRNQVIPNLKKLIQAKKEEVQTLKTKQAASSSVAKVEQELIKLQISLMNWEHRLIDSKYEGKEKDDAITKFDIDYEVEAGFWDTSVNNPIGSLIIKAAKSTLMEGVNQNDSEFSGNSKRFIEERTNISFSHGSNYEFSLESSFAKSSASVFMFDLQTGRVSGAEGKVEGVGFELESSLLGHFAVEHTKTDEVEETTTTGFFLNDKDLGDFFTVDVMKDTRTGIFSFETKAGISMCPHEPNTQQREKIGLSTSELNMINLDPDEVGQATFSLSNLSETGDGSNWSMRLVSKTNPKGAKIKLNGLDIARPVLLDNIDPDASVTINLEIERNPLYFVYEDIQIVFYSNCEFDRWDGNASFSTGTEKYLTINAVFGAPCVNDIQWQRIENNNKITKDTRWLLNSKDERMVTNVNSGLPEAQIVLPIVFNTTKWEEDVTAETFDYFILEYAEETSDNWLPDLSTKIKKADLLKRLGEVETIIWNASSLADGAYKIRIAGVCKDGTKSYSVALGGDISRTPPTTFATYPADGILSKGDQLGIKFNRPINCDIKPYNWKVIGIYNGVRYQPQSLRLDGVDDYVVISESDELMQDIIRDTSDFTLEFWMKTKAKQKATILSNRFQSTQGLSYGMSVEIDAAGKLIFSLIDSLQNHKEVLVSNKMVNDGTWHYIAYRVERENESVAQHQAKLYVDLKEDNSIQFQNKAWGVLDSERPFLIGKHHLGTGNSYDGFIDELRLWSIKRDLSNVQTKNGLLQTWKNHITNSYGMAGYWKFDKVKEGKIFDLVNPNNLGTLVNGAAGSDDVPNWDYENLAFPEYVDADVVCNGDEILFYLPEDINTLKVLENVELTASTVVVKDLFGNRSALHEWSFLVDKNSLAWEFPNIDVEHYQGQATKSFTAKIFNKGATEETFQLLRLPDWLKADPVTASVLPGGYKEVTFTIQDHIGSGSYKTEVFAESDEGWEPLLINARVLCASPSYTINKEVYEGSMNISIPLVVNGKLSTDSKDKVYAFIDGQPRGEGTIQYLSGESTYRALMTIYGNVADTAKQMSFNIWDASACREYSGVKQSFTYTPDSVLVIHVSEEELVQLALDNDNINPDNVIGSEGQLASDLLQITPSGDMAQQYKLGKGWNWLSVNVDPEGRSLSEVINGDFSTDDKIVQGEFSANYQNGAWVGSMSTLNPVEAFRVFTHDSVSFAVHGTLITPKQPIILEAGWNWISFIPEMPLRLDDALESIKNTASKGDVIKTRDAFAYYLPGQGWQGDLKTMHAGVGYQLKTQSDNVLSYQPNKLPKVDIGADRKLVLPKNSLDLIGYASDEDGTVEAYQWSLLKGKSDARLVGKEASSVRLENLALGTYDIVLKVTDNDMAFAFDTVKVEVVANAVPVLTLDNELITALPVEQFSIKAQAIDSDGTIVAYQWEKVSGPAVKMTQVSTATLSLSELEEGDYTFKVTVSDDRNGKASGLVKLTVLPEAGDNVAYNKAVQIYNLTQPTSAFLLVDNDPTTVAYMTADTATADIRVEIDLFGEYELSRFQVNWFSEKFSTDYDVYIAEDSDPFNKSYRKLITLQDQDGGTDLFVAIGKARFVQFVFRNMVIAGSLQIKGIELYGRDLTQGGVLEEKSADKPISTIVNPVDDHGVEKAFDNNPDTYWYPDPNASQNPSFVINLEDTFLIEKIWSFTNPSLIADLEIDMSFDSIQWFSYLGETNQNSLIDDYNGKLELTKPFPAQYVRVTWNKADDPTEVILMKEFKLFARNFSGEELANSIRLVDDNGTFITAVTDGELSTGTAGYKFVVDLGTVHHLSSVLTSWSDRDFINIREVYEYPTAFKVSTAYERAGPYEEIGTVTGGNIPDHLVKLEQGKQGRFVQIQVAGIAPNSTPKLNEVLIFGSDEITNLPPELSFEKTHHVLVLPEDTLSIAPTLLNDPIGSIASIQWSKIKGGKASLKGANSQRLIVEDLEAGDYEFQIVVTDDSAATVSEHIFVKVLPNMVNEALGKPIAATSTGASASTAAAIDGDYESYWKSTKGNRTPAAIWVDLQDEVSIYRILLIDPSAGYDVQVSSDLTHWNTVYSSNGADLLWEDNGVYVYGEDLLFTENQPKGRWVRVSFKNNDYFDDYYLSEIEVYGIPSNLRPTVAVDTTDILVKLPNDSFTVSATANDPDGTIVSYQWRKLSGAHAVITGGDTKSILVSGLQEGTYLFEVTVTDDGGKTAKDRLSVEVGDFRPIVNLGKDTVVVRPLRDGVLDANITFTIAADVSIKQGNIATYQWTQITGGALTLQNPTDKDLTVTNLIEGDYTFRLTATNDDGLSTFDEINITFRKEPTLISLGLPIWFSQYTSYGNFDETNFSKLTDGNLETVDTLSTSQYDLEGIIDFRIPHEVSFVVIHYATQLNNSLVLRGHYGMDEPYIEGTSTDELVDLVDTIYNPYVMDYNWDGVADGYAWRETIDFQLYYWKSRNAETVVLKEISFYGWQADPNLVRIKDNVSITVSSEKAGKEAANLLDDDLRTQWEPNGFTGEFVTLDFGKKYDVYYFYQDLTDREFWFNTEYSEDGINWTMLCEDCRQASVPEWNWGDLILKNVRFMRMNAFTYSTPQLNELIIYGIPTEEGTTINQARVQAQARKAVSPLPSWEVQPSAYEHVMPLVVQVEGLSNHAAYYLGSFNGTTPRGFVESVSHEATPYFFLSVEGNKEGENISYELYDSHTGEVFEIAEMNEFYQNQIKGTVEKPLVFHLAGKAGVTPLFRAIQDQQTKEGDPFKTIDLAAYLDNVNRLNIAWEINGLEQMQYSLNDNLLTVEVPENWFGQEQIAITAQISGLEEPLTQQVNFEVLNTDDAPQWSQLPVIEIQENKPQQINLLSYVQELDGDPVDFQWATSTYFDLDVQEGVLTVSPKGTFDTHQEEVTLMVYDQTSKGLFDTQKITLKSTLSTEEGAPQLTGAFESFPNPFEDKTTFSFDLAQTTTVDLIIYDLNGAEMMKLQKGSLNAGTYQFVWDGTNSTGSKLQKGVYFAKLKTGVGYEEVIKLVRY